MFLGSITISSVSLDPLCLKHHNVLVHIQYVGKVQVGIYSGMYTYELMLNPLSQIMVSGQAATHG
jgi:hypothetical protein